MPNNLFKESKMKILNQKFINFVSIFVFLFLTTSVFVYAQTGFRGNADKATIWPRVIDDILYNPGMGFTTASSFDG